MIGPLLSPALAAKPTVVAAAGSVLKKAATLDSLSIPQTLIGSAIELLGNKSGAAAFVNSLTSLPASGNAASGNAKTETIYSTSPSTKVQSATFLSDPFAGMSFPAIDPSIQKVRTSLSVSEMSLAEAQLCRELKARANQPADNGHNVVRSDGLKVVSPAAVYSLTA